MLEPLKHVLHLIWSAYVISTANRTALKIARGSHIQQGQHYIVIKGAFSNKMKKICHVMLKMAKLEFKNHKN